ncbi:MAG TPA: TonB-dependent receptor [Novosphingobium sp.]|nr:TonB-dependent receptor [Novosphingobium sp.]HZV08595.1 TonB-dependent receptor [Novosphingobium sp.]
MAFNRRAAALSAWTLPLSLVAPQAARAQGDAEPAASNRQLEEIVVTAQRHASTAQKTAASISVMTGEQLAQQNATQVADVVRDVPAVSLNQSAKGGQIYIRGVGGGLDSQIGSPGIALNVDGRYQGQAAAALGALYDVARVEVLRGPQGTLYGRNATAGAVNILTNDPDGKLGGAISAGYGNYNSRRVEAAINVPVTQTLWLRAAGVYDAHDGYLSNGLDSANSKGGRLKLLFKPSDRFSWLVTGELLDMDGVPGTVVSPITGRGNAWAAADSSQAYFGGGAYEHQKTRAVSSKMELSTGLADITWLASYQAFTAKQDYVFAGQAGPMRPTDDATSTELRLASPRGSRISWVGGLYFYHSAKTDLTFTPSSDSTTDYPEIDQKSYAAYAEIKVPILVGLSGSGGIRYTHDTQFDRGRVYTGAPDAANTTAYFTGSGAWSHTDFKLGLEYQLAAQSLLYANYSTGYKAGGLFQGGPPDTYAPEVLKAWVAGSKNRFLDGRLQINAEAYDYRYDNFQVQTIGLIQPTGYGLLIFNAANAHLYGGEIEGLFKASAQDRLSASLALGWGRFGGNFVVNSLFGTGDYSHEAIPQLPRTSIRLGWEHDIDLKGGARLTLHADSEITSGHWVEFTHINGSYQPSYHRTGASLSFEDSQRKWMLTAYVRNIENAPVIESAYQLPGSDSAVQLAPPRTFGASISRKF